MEMLRSMGPRLRGNDKMYSAECIRLRCIIIRINLELRRQRYCCACLTYSTVPAITAGQERNSRSGSHLTVLPSMSVAVML